MKLGKRDRIGAPLAFVYEAFSDFDAWERAAVGRGAEVVRRGDAPAWQVRFAWRGAMRAADIALTEDTRDRRLVFHVTGKPAQGTVRIELEALGPARTQVLVTADVKPRTIPARLFIQSLRLAKARVQRGFDLRVAGVAATIEDRWRAQNRD